MERTPLKRPTSGKNPGSKRRWDQTSNGLDTASIMGAVKSGFSAAPPGINSNSVLLPDQPHLKNKAMMNQKGFQQTARPYTSMVPAAVPHNYTGVTRLVDQLIPIEPKSMNIVRPFAHSQLRVNQKIVLEQERKRHAKHLEKVVENAKNPQQNKFYDSTITGGKKERSTISFVAEGFFAQKEARSAARALGVRPQEIDKKLSVKHSKPVVLKSETLIPPIEPWDLAFLKDHTATIEVFDGLCIEEPVTEYMDLWNINNTEWAKNTTAAAAKKLGQCIDPRIVTLLVQHPVSIIPKGYDTGSVQKVFLTNAERIRLRRRRRRENELEKQDKIRIGLIPPPPPKVKLANLNRVLGVETAVDPSSVEARVRADMKKRIGDHERRNQDRKLKPEQKREKKITYWKQEETLKSQTLVQVYSIPKTSRDNLYKIDQNAQQMHLSGFMVPARQNQGMIVVEGGPRATRRFKRLILRRLKWGGKSLVDIVQEDEDDLDDHDEFFGGKGRIDCYADVELDRVAATISQTDDKRPNVLWEGLIKEAKFKKWKHLQGKEEQEIHKYLENRDASFYWCLLEKCRIVEDDNKI